jgi:dipeptide transport system ATP-binding protein
MALLEVSDLSIGFDTLRGELKAVDGMSFSIEEGETLGIVGESGCGKSMTSLAIMGLLPPNAKLNATRLQFQNHDLLKINDTTYRSLRGGDMAMIFQDPMTSLNPCFTVGYQLTEVLHVHQKLSKKESQAKAIELLERVGIADPERRLSSYPHQLSGGMCQRVMIACAIACRPKLLIADEPTTALDVTIQAQILDLLKELQQSFGMAMILITHNLGLVSEMAKRIAVMYAGQIVETGPTAEVIHAPTHPYTAGLLECLPDSSRHIASKSPLPSIPGMVPDLVHRPTGCQLHPRCKFVQTNCRTTKPELRGEHSHSARCFYPLSPPGAEPRGTV